jgi:hypothetical protein
MLPKKILITLVLIVAVIVTLAFWLGSVFFAAKNPAAPSEYSAVYLSTGDIYFGKLSWFPWPHMKNVWYLQRGQDVQGQAQLGLVPLKNVFWGPIDEIYLNPKDVVFWTSLRNDSQVAQAFANPSALMPAPVPSQGTSTLQGP